MRQRRPLRARKPWEHQHKATEKPKAQRTEHGPDALEQGKFEIVARSGGLCETRTEWCQPGTHRGYHAHHVQMRSQGINHSAGNLLWVCSDAHAWIHAHPRESYANGWLVHADRMSGPGIGGSYFKPGMLDD